MGMSFAYGPTDEAESLRVLGRYLELGGNFLDTAEIYGPYTNEELLGRFLRNVPRDPHAANLGSVSCRTVRSAVGF